MALVPALLTGVWIVGMVVCTARQLRRIGRLASLVRLAKGKSEQLTGEIEAVAVQLGMRPPRAVTAGIDSPFVWSLGRVRLVWPESIAGREAVIRSRGVIAHELAHLRRGDHCLAWVELVAGLIWWWNPLFWFVSRRVRESAELACDAVALSACPAARRNTPRSCSSLLRVIDPRPWCRCWESSPAHLPRFERRLSMILSDRVSGRMPLWGFLAATVLALVSLPGWSLAQKPEERTAGSPGEVAPQVDQNPGTTTVRLEQIEAELKRLSGLLEETKRSAANEAKRPLAGSKRSLFARWHSLKIIDKNPLSVSFGYGTSRTYFVNTKDGYGSVSAFTNKGQQLWDSQLPRSLRTAEPGHWSIKESMDEKQLMLNFASNSEFISFQLDAATGKMINETVHFQNERDLRSATKAAPATAAAENRKAFSSVVDELRKLNASGPERHTTTKLLRDLIQTDEKLAQILFSCLLHRNATPDELAFAIKRVAAADGSSARRDAIQDVAGAIINSKEFQAIVKVKGAPERRSRELYGLGSRRSTSPVSGVRALSNRPPSSRPSYPIA